MMNESTKQDGRGIATTPGAIDKSTSSEPDRFHIVGVGASAGGLEALESFFSTVPPHSGMAFVVVQHLSPDFKSMMDELLARHTKLQVCRAADGMPVEPNSIYLIPPKKEIIIQDGQLLLSDKDPAQGLSLPIDVFFRSLAQEVGDHSIGIILSGTGSDGSRGVRAIHEAGGLVIAQSEDSARFDGLPKAAIETGIVDVVMPPDKMADVLMRFVADAHVLPAEESADHEDALNGIFKLLRLEYGIDFSWYKTSTVSRRIERRLQLVQSHDMEDDVERLRTDEAELNQLYRDLLIGVTKFFRDPAAFDRLARDVIPQILSQTPDNSEARFWVAGCATGEEAYSLAILIHEQLEILKHPIDVKNFATDVHRASLDHASAGRFDASSLSELSPERLDRYFNQVGDGYQVAPDLRKMIVFAPQNVIKNAPFTKIDLVSCRNLLIYLQLPAKRRKEWHRRRANSDKS